MAEAHADETDATGAFPQAAVDAVRRAGLLGAMVPEALGGLGLPPSRIGAIAARLGAACSSTGMVFAMHQSQVACLVGHGLQAGWHRDFLARIASEGLLLASATSEAGVGGRVRTSRCAMQAAGDGFVNVTKDATAVSYGAHADALLVTARRAPDAPESDQVLVVAERARCGMEPRGRWDAMGMRGTRTEPFLITLRVPEAQVVPAPFGDIASASMLPASHLFWASLWLGIAGNAVDRARAFLRQGARAGRDMPPTAVRLVDAMAALQTLQSRTHRLLARFDVRMARAVAGLPLEGPPVSEGTELNGLKLAVSEGALEAARQALLVTGFAGYQNGTPFSVARHLRDLLSAPLMIANDAIRAGMLPMLLDRSPTLGREDW